MAKRTIYIPRKNGTLFVDEKHVEFQWFAGLSKAQKQKSILSLHGAAEKIGISPILEISSKSPTELGVNLSAFNLEITTKLQRRKFSVESAFQGSKVFQNGGPYVDLFYKTAREAKKDIRLRESGNLIKFAFFNKEFPLKPRTYFYDWLYINALNQNQSISESLLKYAGFTDIEFNPEKSINCQAFSAALFVTLQYSSVYKNAISSPEIFVNVLEEFYEIRDKKYQIQKSLM